MKYSHFAKGLLLFLTFISLVCAIFFQRYIGTSTTGTLLDSSSGNVTGKPVAKDGIDLTKDHGQEDNVTDSAMILEGMNETFHDDFNSFSRYTKNNGDTTCEPGGVGTWQTIYHFCERTSPANKEAEIYTDPSFLSLLSKRQRINEKEHIGNTPFEIVDGKLRITAEPSSEQVMRSVGRWAKYTSGLITTQFSFSQRYGYFEIRAKLPRGKGLWPAFWLLPTDRTWPPEVDIMEAFGGPNDNNFGGLSQLHYAFHSPEKTESCGEWKETGLDLTKDFHTYGVNIQPNTISYYFDGKVYANCKTYSRTDKPFFILINLAVGGPGSWPGEPDESNKWPAVFEIDYVKVFQSKQN